MGFPRPIVRRTTRFPTLRPSSGAAGRCSTATAQAATVGQAKAPARTLSRSFPPPLTLNGWQGPRRTGRLPICTGASPKAALSSNLTCPHSRTSCPRRIPGPSSLTFARGCRGAHPNGPLGEVHMEQPALGILGDNRIMTIATVRADGWPQTTVVGYANEGWRIYFLIYRTSQKFANIARDNRVSISVAHEPRSLRDVKAVYAGCIAREVTET